MSNQKRYSLLHDHRSAVPAVLAANGLPLTIFDKVNYRQVAWLSQ